MAPDGVSLLFNGEDISEEASAWTDAYIEGDFRKLGFVFADTLTRHSVTGNFKA